MKDRGGESALSESQFASIRILECNRYDSNYRRPDLRSLRKKRGGGCLQRLQKSPLQRMPGFRHLGLRLRPRQSHGLLPEVRRRPRDQHLEGCFVTRAPPGDFPFPPFRLCAPSNQVYDIAATKLWGNPMWLPFFAGGHIGPPLHSRKNHDNVQKVCS